MSIELKKYFELFKKLEKRLNKIEEKRINFSLEEIYIDNEENDTPNQKRVRDSCKSLHLNHIKFFSAPEYYYSVCLKKRSIILGCDAKHLCKTVLMKNTQCTRNDCKDPTNSLYYMVIIQYMSKLNCEILRKEVKGLRTTDVLSKRSINFQFASPEECNEITGFPFNGVTPFGFPTTIPLIISKNVAELDPPFIWLGGGEVHLKLYLDVEELIKNVDPYIFDCTMEREESIDNIY